jgi:hypothetical protein
MMASGFLTICRICVERETSLYLAPEDAIQHFSGHLEFLLTDVQAESISSAYLIGGRHGTWKSKEI